MALVTGVLGSKVFVACIPCTVCELTLKGAAVEFGSILQLFYCPDKQNGDSGFAFVTFADDDAAVQCVAALDKTRHFPNSNRPLSVSFARNKIYEADVFACSGLQVPSAAWREYKTEEGFLYYHNLETTETVWQKPEYFVSHLPILESRVSQLGRRGTNLFCIGVDISNLSKHGPILHYRDFSTFSFVSFTDLPSALAALNTFRDRMMTRPGEVVT